MDDSKNKFWKGALVGALVTAFAGLVIVGMSTGIFMIGKSVIRTMPETQLESESQSESTVGGSVGTGPDLTETPSSSINWNQFDIKSKAIQSVIERYFLFDEDGTKVEDSMYKGLMAGLNDPYSVYYTPDEYKKLMETTTGTYSGIGALVSKNMKNGQISAAKVFRNAPAEEAGLMTGDVFLVIDGVNLTIDTDLDLLVNEHVKGKDGTPVHVKVYRPSINDYVEMDIMRRQIDVPTVEHRMQDGQIGYISVAKFEVATTAQFKEAVDDLTAQGMKGLVIDLRGNPGGVLDSAVDMADYLLPDHLTQYSKTPGQTLVVYTADKNGNGQSYSCKDGHGTELPVVILVNGNSASASEVFAGAMRDYDRGKLVGTTTYGKGIVQNLVPLGDGSAIKLTTAHYYSPSGFDLHGIGLDPDVECEFVLPELAEGQTFTDADDNQLQKALEVVKEEIQ